MKWVVTPQADYSTKYGYYVTIDKDTVKLAPPIPVERLQNAQLATMIKNKLPEQYSFVDWKSILDGDRSKRPYDDKRLANRIKEVKACMSLIFPGVPPEEVFGMLEAHFNTPPPTKQQQQQKLKKPRLESQTIGGK
jgi:hypothetical protein